MVKTFYENDEEILVFPEPNFLEHDRKAQDGYRNIDEVVNIEPIPHSTAIGEDLTATSSHYMRAVVRHIIQVNAGLKENDRLKYQLATDGGDIVPIVADADRDDVMIVKMKSNTTKLDFGSDENEHCVGIITYRGLVNIYVGGNVTKIDELYDKLVQRAYYGPDEFLKNLEIRERRFKELMVIYNEDRNLRPILKSFIEDYKYMVDTYSDTNDFNIINSVLSFTHFYISFIINQCEVNSETDIYRWFREEEYKDFLSKWEKIQIGISSKDVKNLSVPLTSQYIVQ